MPFISLNGHPLFYREQGSGPLLIILPGNTASSACHEQELAEFGRRYHAVALDLLGTGQSQRLETWPEDWWQQAAQDALALIPALGQQQAILVGTSGGAVAALWAAILNPARVKTVIADSLTKTMRPEDLRAEVRAREQKTPGQVAFWSKAHGAEWEQVVAADNRILLAFADQGGNWFEGRLKEIRCPVLFSGSLQDELLPEIGEQMPRMAAQVAESEVFLVNGGGHPLMWSRPAAFHAMAAAFLEQIERM
ncbi:MAG: alpha/beta hydrolase [Anaerolineaceae bacterium]|nr:alpha/beta hydrolase [Anaerolineaceae bacterium]